jgi:O-glycosyl hydrolase
MAAAQNLAPTPNPPAGMVRVFESTEQTVGEPEERSPISFGPQRAPEPTIFVNDAKRYQEIDGFGASVTDSSAWLLRNKLSDSQFQKLMERLFDREKGIGLSLLRQPIGSSDFALEDYTYDDMPPGESDTELQHFSIEKDQRYIIPVLRTALAINPQIKILATPWSPPAWMKSNDSLVQGSLRPEDYDAMARYFVKSVKAYEQAGVPIFAVTMQNEPLNIEADYPSMLMSASEQSAFLGSALGPAFRTAGMEHEDLHLRPQLGFDSLSDRGFVQCKGRRLRFRHCHPLLRRERRFAVRATRAFSRSCDLDDGMLGRELAKRESPRRASSLDN